MKIFCLLVISFILTSIIGADTIFLKKGAPVREAKVSSENQDKVTYSVNGQSRTMASENVQWIEYSDSPQELIDGRNETNKGNYEVAVGLVQKAIEIASLPSRVGDWFSPYGSFYLAKAYQGWADSDPNQKKLYETAINQYNNTLKIKDNRFIYECYFGIVQCYIQLEQYDKASSFLSKLESEARNSKYWLVEASLWSGHLDIAKESFSTSISKYERAKSLAERENFPLLVQKANICIGNAYTKNKKFSDAQSHFSNMLKKAGKEDYEAIAAARIGIATTLLESGKIQEARRVIIDVILSLYQADEQRPNALYIAGLCYESLPKEKGYEKRAKVYYQFLKQGYPGNQWTVKALRRLQKIGESE